MEASYAPRDPIAEYWQGRITLRHLRVLVQHMPAGNALERELGEGWCELEWLTHDVGDMLRDVQKTIANVSPWVKHPMGEADVRPRMPSPMERVRQSAPKRAGRREDARHARERSELMALVTGRKS